MKKKVPEEKKVKVSIALDPNILKVLDDLAVLHNRSRSNIMETMLRQELEIGTTQSPPLINTDKTRGAGFSIQSKLIRFDPIEPTVQASGVVQIEN
jgi:hypothetical protein